MSTLLLDREAVRNLLHMPEVMDAVEQAFKAWYSGLGNMPPKAYLSVEKGDFRAMPASLPGCAGMKWVNAHPDNRGENLPAVMAVIIYNDPETGYPLAIMEGAQITAYRTGAATAIASKYLARPDSRSLGIIGAGCQAYTQIAAHTALFTFKAINIFDISQKAIDRVIQAFPDHPIRACSAEEAASCDIVCTLTPSRNPIVKHEWIQKGTHVNAVGADAAGKQELAPDILNNAVVVVDDIRQASASGEINVPISKGIFSADDVYANLPEIVSGDKPGRTSMESITLFDSTGIAIEDMAAAQLIYRKAMLSGGYPLADMVERKA